MKLKHNQIRAFGQRSIPSSFILPSCSNLGKNTKEDDAQNQGSNKNSSISLSDFLGQKLHSSSVPNKIVKGKSRPFKSPLGSRDDSGSCMDPFIRIRKKEEEKNSVVHQIVFEQFKPTSAEKGDDIGLGGAAVAAGGCGKDNVENGSSGTSIEMGSSHVSEIVTSNSNEQVPRKRRNPFEDDNGKNTTRKHLLVLGDDPEPKRKTRRKKRFFGNKKPGPLFNHYGNGSGWWDCDMEGVDTEEVGLGDVWEGVGSTTFGVIDWH